MVVVGAEWGVLAQPAIVVGVWVGWPRAVAQVVGKAGKVTAEVRQGIAEVVAARLPRARDSLT